MYENENYKIQINWKNLILKLAAIIVGILLIIWVFPMPKLDTFYNKVFNDNLNSVKSAAENYFTEDNLPGKTGSTTTIKLQDMLDKKIIMDFVDKNNNTCDQSNSYAQVTKTENDTYVLKVQLSCDDKTDYILENLNTTKSSTNTTNTTNNDNEHAVTQNNSEDDAEDIIDSNANYDKDGNKIEYQYKKAVTKNSTSYSCPTGYVLDNNICYKYETGETIKATELYFDDITTTTNAKKNSSGSYTVTIIPNKEIDKQEKVCPTGYTLNGNICYKYQSVNVNPGSASYSCPSGYSQNGSICTKTINAYYSNNSSTYYTCSDGSQPVGTQCPKYNTVTTYTTSCQCPTGYNTVGSSCVKYTSSSYTATPKTTWSNPTTTSSKTQLTEYNNGSSKRTLISHTCTIRGCTFVYYNYTAKTTYSCPNGGNLSGSRCYTSTPSYANKTCSSTPHTTTQVTYYSAQKHENGGSYYYCPSGYSLSGNNCTQTINANTSTTDTTYSCPTGYVKDGSTCYQYTEPTNNITYKYTCPDGYNKNGNDKSTTCSKTIQSNTTYYCEDANSTLVDDKCLKVVKGGLKGYTCPTNYILNNDTCVKKTTECTNPEEVTNTSTSYEYKWSTESNLDGWTRTGKTQNTTSTNTSLNNDYDK